MDQLQWKPDEPVEVSVLGERAGAPIPARILEIAGKRVCVGSAAHVEGGAAVRLEGGGQLVLGEVIDTGPGRFWVEIHHMLLDTAAMNWQKQGWRG